jgi:hypothetical protein
LPVASRSIVHDILPKQLLRREDRDQSSACVATINGSNARLATHPRGQTAESDRPDWIGAHDRARAGPPPGRPAAPATFITTTFSRAWRTQESGKPSSTRNESSGESVPRSDVTPRTSASARGTAARIAGRAGFLDGLEIECELLPCDFERNQHLGLHDLGDDTAAVPTRSSGESAVSDRPL